MDQSVDDFEQDLDSILTVSVDMTGLVESLMMFMLCLLQSLQGLYAQLELFLKLLNHSLLLASSVINNDTNLDLYFCLCPTQVKFQHLS